eukprot:CAMPEP_0172319338 /NCGR_PEP_ID=MMETSP1058-20130122/37382_1 /TAXON_ID=83371 /ORGANISM="Detonula confervacea, Strain CCMP 353" /LENGTH=516 /DNA_ID=CAMNT_0013034355 /DNA_START=39 /DNA_END=1586 /DNA_ORIENTATION=-
MNEQPPLPQADRSDGEKKGKNLSKKEKKRRSLAAKRAAKKIAVDDEGMPNEEGDTAAHLNNNSAADMPIALSIANNEDATAPLPPPLPLLPPPNIIDHNRQCETCGFGGRLICCHACNLVFHWGCTRPQLIIPPVGDWFCAYCHASDGDATKMERQSARSFAEEITTLKNEAMSKRSAPAATEADIPASKRLRSSPPQENIDLTQETTTENSDSITTDNDASEFVKSFFQKDKPTQQKLLRALLTDDRVSGVLPAQSAVGSHIPNPSSSGLSYNNEFISLTDAENYQPLDPTAFHYYPPNTHGGVHRSLHDENMDRSNFNIHNAANKSCLHFANQINSFIMGLTLTKEQRRSALWKSFSLPGTRQMVQSYGFSTKNTSIGLIIARNVQNYMKRLRSTNHRNGRVPDAQQAATRAIITGALTTPPRPQPRDANNTQNTNNTRRSKDSIPDRQLLQWLGLPQGSHKMLGICKELRRASKDGLAKSYDFMGPRRSWKKVPDDDWDNFRHVWLPNCSYVI